MILLCTETKRLYYYVLVPVFILSIIIGVLKNNWILLVCLFILFFAFVYLLQKLSMKNTNEVNRELLCNLETRRYIEFYEKAIKNRLRGDILLLANANLVTGYLAAGVFDKALEVCNKLKYHPNMAKKPEIELSYLAAYIECFISVGYFESVESFFQEADRLLRKTKDKTAISLNNTMDLLKLQYGAEVGDFDGFEGLYIDLLKRVENPYQKVKLKYIGGIYYEKIGEHQKALSEFQYVAENGETIFIAEQAHEWLEKKSVDGSVIES